MSTDREYWMVSLRRYLSPFVDPLILLVVCSVRKVYYDGFAGHHTGRIMQLDTVVHFIKHLSVILIQ